MVVNRTALWGLIATCCLVAVPWAVRWKASQAREDGSSLAAACVDGVLTGLGVGMAAAMAIFLAAGAVVQLSD